jgi:CRP-like cAMP-binding protein
MIFSLNPGDCIMQNMGDALKNCVLFDHLPSDKISSLLSKVIYTVKHYRRNEVIFSPHQLCDSLGIILDGKVDIQKIFPSGKMVTINRRGKFDLIADASLFADTEYYPSTIVACVDSHILLFSKTNLMKLFSMDERILSKFLRSVSNRVLALNYTIEILSLCSVAAKISYYLINQYKKHGSNIIRLEFTKKSLAEYLNVSRPTLSRELKNMQKMGIISFDRHHIQINNLDRLVELSSD